MSDLERAAEWLGCDTPPDSTWCEEHMHPLPCHEAARLAALLAETRADAVDDVARSIQINNWIDLFTGPLPQRVGNSQRVVDWLREQAAEMRQP